MIAARFQRRFGGVAWLSLFGLIMLTGCTTGSDTAGDESDFTALIFDGSTRRVLPYPYHEVVAACRERFVRTWPGGLFALRAELEEEPEEQRLTVIFHEFIDYGHVMELELSVTGLDEQRTKVGVTINKYYRNWYFRGRQTELEQPFLKVIEQRLATGHWADFPWMKARPATADTRHLDAPTHPANGASP